MAVEIAETAFLLSCSCSRHITGMWCHYVPRSFRVVLRNQRPSYTCRFFRCNKTTRIRWRLLWALSRETSCSKATSKVKSSFSRSLYPWACAGGEKRAFSSLEFGTKNQKFLDLKLAAKFQLIHLIVAKTVYLPVCTRARLAVLVSCNDEITVRSCQFLHLQMQVAKLENGLFYCWSLLRNNNAAINLQTFTSSYGSRRFSACDQCSSYEIQDRTEYGLTKNSLISSVSNF